MINKELEEQIEKFIERICPISLQPIVTPVRLLFKSDKEGEYIKDTFRIFDEKNIEKWMLEAGKKCPFTRKPFERFEVDINIQEEINNVLKIIDAKILFGENQVIKYWLKSGGDPDQTLQDGRSLLQKAIDCEQEDIVKILLKKGAGIKENDRAEHLFHFAISKGWESVVKTLLKLGVDVNKPLNGIPPIFLANSLSFKNRINIVNILLKNGARLNSGIKFRTCHDAVYRANILKAFFLIGLKIIKGESIESFHNNYSRKLLTRKGAQFIEHVNFKPNQENLIKHSMVTYLIVDSIKDAVKNSLINKTSIEQTMLSDREIEIMLFKAIYKYFDCDLAVKVVTNIKMLKGMESDLIKLDNFTSDSIKPIILQIKEKHGLKLCANSGGYFINYQSSINNKRTSAVVGLSNTSSPARKRQR